MMAVSQMWILQDENEQLRRELKQLRAELAEAKRNAVPWQDGGARNGDWAWSDDVSDLIAYVNCTQPITHVGYVNRRDWNNVSTWFDPRDLRIKCANEVKA